MIHLEQRYFNIVQSILSKYPYTFYAFGSRVTGKNKKLSDLDIVFKDFIPSATKVAIESEFDDSRLPFEIDLVDYNLISTKFQDEIKSSMLVIQEGSNYSPDKDVAFPRINTTRTCFLKNIITRSNIEVGDYTYYDDPEDVHNFEKNVLYHFDFIGDHLKIGKFCQIAAGFKCIMNGAQHSISGVSTYPFHVFGGVWSKKINLGSLPQSKGDTVIGNDVWIGNSAVLMPGVKIGDGAIIGAHALVTKDVMPYTIVGGNPAREIRQRFDTDTVKFLLQLQWWNWPIEMIITHGNDIVSANIDKLKNL